MPRLGTTAALAAAGAIVMCSCSLDRSPTGPSDAGPPARDGRPPADGVVVSPDAPIDLDAPGPGPCGCDDGNVCTTDSCDAAGACSHAPADGTSCDDANACTTGDVCSGGSCAGGVAVPCDDGNPCTLDACNPSTGACETSWVDGACEDGDSCTGPDVCVAGVCTPGGSACDDSDVCTTDSCDATTGACVWELNSARCEDGNPCTTNDHCVFGLCESGAIETCDDRNACTTDSCSALSGCVHVSIECRRGACIGMCDPSDGECLFPPGGSC